MFKRQEAQYLDKHNALLDTVKNKVCLGTPGIAVQGVGALSKGQVRDNIVGAVVDPADRISGLAVERA